MLLKQKFGIWGQQLWLFSNGQWNEPLVLEIKDRTTISSATTLPQDERDYEAALTFMLSESTRLTGQLRREQMQAREFSVSIRFNDFTEVGTSHRFKHPQFLNSVRRHLGFKLQVRQACWVKYHQLSTEERYEIGHGSGDCARLLVRHFRWEQMKNFRLSLRMASRRFRCWSALSLPMWIYWVNWFLAYSLQVVFSPSCK